MTKKDYWGNFWWDIIDIIHTKNLSNNIDEIVHSRKKWLDSHCRYDCLRKMIRVNSV